MEKSDAGQHQSKLWDVIYIRRSSSVSSSADINFSFWRRKKEAILIWSILQDPWTREADFKNENYLQWWIGEDHRG
jgi:hypothetical protein